MTEERGIGAGGGGVGADQGKGLPTNKPLKIYVHCFENQFIKIIGKELTETGETGEIVMGRID